MRIAIPVYAGLTALDAVGPYDPEPPFDAGSRGKAPNEIVERLLARTRG
jgi:hypothetical protein